MINEVFEFNNKALGVQPKELPQLEYKHAAFCIKAIREEATELEDEHNRVIVDEDGKRWMGDAIVHSDPASVEARWQTVKSIDALIDAAYFAIGGLARAGLTVEQAIDCFLAVQEANMTKKLGVNKNRGDMEVADAVKPADFVPPERKMYKIIFGVDAPVTDVQTK